MAFRLPEWAPGRTGLWHSAMPAFGIEEEDPSDLLELFDWIDQGELVEAHNSFFERGLWRNICEPKMFWPRIKHEQWRCSAAKCAAHALPRGLEDAVDALGLPIAKDTEGADIMRKMASPRQPLKAEVIAWGVKHAPCKVCAGKGKVQGVNPATGRAKGMPCGRCKGLGYMVRSDIPPMPVLWHESKELFERLWAYCRIDVLAEEGVSEALPDLTEEETAIYLLDQAMNERGFALDPDAIDAALALVGGEFAELNAELATLTGGAVTKASQRAKLTAWFAQNGLELDDTQAATIDDALGRSDLRPDVRRGLGILRLLGRSSTKKFEAMRNWICPDSRVHGGLLYHGASTGRWTGKGIQPHNFPKGQIKDQDYLWAVLATRDREAVMDCVDTDPKTGEPLWSSVMDALSQGLRGVITAPPGKVLYVADFAQIEARMLLWAAGDHAGLDIFRRGEDIYSDMASSIFGRKIDRKKGDVMEGMLGKVAILGLGYQMGAAKFVDTAWTMGKIVLLEDFTCRECGRLRYKHRDADNDHAFVTDEDPDIITSVQVVNAYRTKFWRVKQLWQDQEQAAIQAVDTERVVRAGKFTWHLDGSFLYCTLPSGRRLAYPDAAVVDRKVPWGGTRPSLVYMGVDTRTHQWSRQAAYGGLLVENQVQAIARDLMAGAMLALEQSDTYTPVLSVHDEAVAEADEGTGDVQEFEALMAACPVWAAELPVACEGFSARRYRK